MKNDASACCADDELSITPAHGRMRMLAASAMAMATLTFALAGCGGSSDPSLNQPAINESAATDPAPVFPGGDSSNSEGSAGANVSGNLPLPLPGTEPPVAQQSDNTLPSSGGTDIPLSNELKLRQVSQ
jgi:hypothetical protein